MTYLNEGNPPLEEAIVHFGVKGMQWGVRRQHRLNSASRANDRAAAKKSRVDANNARNKSIDEARLRVNSGRTRQNLKDAKATYKTDKRVIGKREARKSLNEAKIKSREDRDMARQIKSGRETTTAVLTAVGAVAISTLVKVAAANHGGVGSSGPRMPSSPLPPRKLVLNPVTGVYS